MKRKSKRRRRKNKILWVLMICMGISAITLCATKFIGIRKDRTTPEEVLLKYMGYIQEQNYIAMYQLIDVEASGQISEEDFVKRNSAIYEGIEVQNMAVTILSCDMEKNVVRYQTDFDTVAGEISFENEAYFLKTEDTYKLAWMDALIYPELLETDKVRVSVTQAKRGEILDRNGRVLAGKGTASSVGIVPGKLENQDDSLKQIADLLGMKPEEIEKKLSAKWVKDDSFVPVKKLRKVEEIELMSLEPDEEALKEYERQQRLLEIPGVMISDTEVRSYPLKDAAAHLVGYVQNVTAEDLENHVGEGYTASSVIGRSGAEGLFEKELKGQNGCRIYIVDSDGNEKEELACRIVENGKDIKLTIDSELQKALYEQFQSDKSCSVAMNPYTGEVLALVSTPSYDNNDFIMGLSSEKWAALKIGAEEMKDSLLHLGFQEELPFEIVMAKSQYSNTENIETEIQLAVSGYGQGQILINPLHMACIYTAFCNEGNIIKPHLLYSQETKTEYWIPNAFSVDHTNIVLEG